MIVLVLLVVVAEGLAQGSYRAIHGTWWSPEALSDLAEDAGDPRQLLQAGQTGEEEVPPNFAARIHHPYFGFVYPPPAEKQESFGFATTNPIVDSQEGGLTVLLLGGSVAAQLGEALETALTEALKDTGRPASTVTVVNAAHGGYKQPQQLMTAAYFLALGAKYDVIVDFAGLNEVWLSISRAAIGIHPSYPQAWEVLTTREPSNQMLAFIGKIVFAREAARETLRAAVQAPWARTALAGLYLTHRLESLRGEIRRASAALEDAAAARAEDYVRTGPDHPYRNEEAAAAFGARVWADAAIQLNALARDAGAIYFEVLQPSQYLEGTKPLSAEERERFAPVGHPLEALVRKHYPKLLAEAERLKTSGIRFIDGRRFFAGEPRTVYRDACCHFNALGVRLASARLAEAMLEAAPSLGTD